MPAALRFLDDDQTTVITSENQGNVATPGTSTAVKRYVENFGDQDAESAVLALGTVGTNDGVDYGQLAFDSGGSPGTFGSSPLSLGTLTPGTKFPFWLRVSVPAGRTADNNPRRFDVVATALSI